MATALSGCKIFFGALDKYYSFEKCFFKPQLCMSLAYKITVS